MGERTGQLQGQGGRGGGREGGQEGGTYPGGGERSPSPPPPRGQQGGRGGRQNGRSAAGLVEDDTNADYAMAVALQAEYDEVNPKPAPCTLHLLLHPAPDILHPRPNTVHPATPYTLHLHSKP
jgi:hypothetical protein